MTGKTFTYDANGNLTADGSRTLAWNGHNGVKSYEVGTFRIEYSYNGRGLRMVRRRLSRVPRRVSNT